MAVGPQRPIPDLNQICLPVFSPVQGPKNRTQCNYSDAAADVVTAAGADSNRSICTNLHRELKAALPPDDVGAAANADSHRFN
jgi:hypothetical protein